MDLSMLNEKQREAVMHTDGPLLILAGPGSGKTRVLTNKIAYLLQNKKVLPIQVLAITFTNKAAKEMKERLYQLIGKEINDMQLSTFHSFGLRIIKENYDEFGLNKTFTILDETDSISLIKRILKEKNIDEKIVSPKYIKNKISSAKNNLVDNIEYTKYSKSKIEEVVSEVYKKYQEALLQSSSVDFDDLLFLPVKLLKTNKDILNQYMELFKYIYVDEYQDTNEAQYTLIKMIASKYKNITVVGDESQNIYSWRGANYKNILNFESDYKDATIILLEQNYRSTKTIINAANNVIKNNKEKKEKNLWTENEEGNKIIYTRTKDEKDEVNTVIEEIIRLNKEIDLKDIAVLYRTNAQSRTIENKFLERNIPYKIIGAYTYYNRKEIKDLISYLNIINNQKDDISFLRCINTPKRGIGKKTIEELEDKSRDKGSLFESIESGKELEFKKLILSIIEKKDKLSLTELVDLILTSSGMIEEYKKENSPESLSRIENLNEFKSITKEFENLTGNLSLEDFLSEISLLSDIENNKENKNAVSLMTMHSAKGLEFDVVFILGLEEDIFPHFNSSTDTSDLEEERRLFYVAITRSKKYLYLLNTKERMLYGKRNSNMPSRFINEIDSKYIESKETFIEEETNDFVDYFYEEDVSYEIGNHVSHDVFKDGIIVAMDGDILTVAFSRKYGIKKLMKNHKSLRKKW